MKHFLHENKDFKELIINTSREKNIADPALIARRNHGDGVI